MLKVTKSITLNGQSIIDGQQAMGFQATIRSDNPEDITFSSWQQNKTLYKANRAECRADEAAFEDAAYDLQDEMLEAAEEE